jgi:hypothetical protein
VRRAGQLQRGVGARRPGVPVNIRLGRGRAPPRRPTKWWFIALCHRVIVAAARAPVLRCGRPDALAAFDAARWHRDGCHSHRRWRHPAAV